MQDFDLVKAGIKTRLLNPRVEEMAEDKAGNLRLLQPNEAVEPGSVIS